MEGPIHSLLHSCGVYLRQFEADVSKIKSPKGKKKLSLARDHRNTYGENPEASRKGIRRGKQRSHMEERRAVGHVLRHLKEKPDEDRAIEADVLSKTLTLQKKRKAFKKRADEPLGAVIKRKLARRDKLEMA
jgi:transketolase